MERIALVTGANRGLGKEASRQLAERGYHVLLTARTREKAAQAAQEIPGKVDGLVLDVANPRDIERVAEAVRERFGRLDVLINNAGILPGGRNQTFKATLEDIRHTFETNTLGAFHMCQKLLPLMLENGYGRVVNVSSGMGQLSDMDGGYPAYRISKTALNAVTRIFAQEGRDKNVLVNSVCPGWVRTDMGGPNAHRSLEEGVDTIVWAATLPDDGPTGGFFRDRKPIPW